MRRAAIILLAATVAATARAQEAPRQAAGTQEAADRFQLDLAPVANDAASATAAPDAPAPRFTLDTAVGELLADYRSKAVLDRDLPGLSVDKNLDKFKALSLNRLAPLSGGRLTPELLDKVGKHLRAIEPLDR